MSTARTSCGTWLRSTAPATTATGVRSAGLVEDVTDDLARERGRVEPSLARDRERRPARALAGGPRRPRRARRRGRARAERGEPSREPAGRARTRELAHVDAESLAVACGERGEPLARAASTSRAVAPFCGPNTRGASRKRVSTSHATRPRRREVEAERLERAEAAVDRRGAADGDDHAVAPASSAAGSARRSRSSSRGRVVVRTDSASPLARAISTTAVPSGAPTPRRALAERPATASSVGRPDPGRGRRASPRRRRPAAAQRPRAGAPRPPRVRRPPRGVRLPGTCPGSRGRGRSSHAASAHHDGSPDVAERSHSAEFGFPGPLRDSLVAAILRGEKTSTTGLYEEYRREGRRSRRSAAGARRRLRRARVAVIETTEVEVKRMGEVDLRSRSTRARGSRRSRSGATHTSVLHEPGDDGSARRPAGRRSTTTRSSSAAGSGWSSASPVEHACARSRREVGTNTRTLSRYVVSHDDGDDTLGQGDGNRRGLVAAAGGREAVHDRVELLETTGGERLVRFSYATSGSARRGPVTLRERDLAKLGGTARANARNSNARSAAR